MHRSYGNELWEFDELGLMRRREASINDVAIPETIASSSGQLPAHDRKTTLAFPMFANSLSRFDYPFSRRFDMTFSTYQPFALGLLTLVAMLSNWQSTWAEQPVKVYHKTIKVGDLDIFYREAGPKDAPAILLLHGFPTSSQMFRNLIPALGDKYRVIAPTIPATATVPCHRETNLHTHLITWRR